MTKLHENRCEACRAGAPKLSEAEQIALLPEIPGWQIIDDGVAKLVRHFQFGDFMSAMAFTNRVAELAEQQNHHPQITVTWGDAEVTWWTHKIAGLHHNDFVMAAKTSQLYSS